MKKNIKGIGRWARGISGVAIFAVGFLYQSWWGLVGLFPIWEAAVAWCPFHAYCNKKSCRNKE